MLRSEFEQLVRQAVSTLPEEFKKVLDNVEITIEAAPTAQQLQKLHMRRGVTLFGLYEGIPQTKRTANYTMVIPDKITIFQEPIEQYYGDEEQMAQHVRDVVLHEIGHHFGLSDKEIRKAGK